MNGDGYTLLQALCYARKFALETCREEKEDFLNMWDVKVLLFDVSSSLCIPIALHPKNNRISLYIQASHR